MYTLTKDNSTAKEKTMAHYEFITKDGKRYSTMAGKNRFEAQLSLEIQFQTSLKGAAFRELDKHNRVIYQGTC